MKQRQHPHGSPEWIVANCDPMVAFERTVQRAMTKMLEERDQTDALLAKAEAVLTRVVGQKNPHRYGNDAAEVVFQGQWREDARQLLADIRAKGQP